MSAAANALTNLARAAVTIGVGATAASQMIYDGTCRDTKMRLKEFLSERVGFRSTFVRSDRARESTRRAREGWCEPTSNN